MATRRKTITVTKQQDEWIRQQVAAGDFTNDSEYIRDLIRRDQSRRRSIQEIRQALIEGENSGDALAFDVGAFKQRMANRYGGSSS